MLEFASLFPLVAFYCEVYVCLIIVTFVVFSFHAHLNLTLAKLAGFHLAPQTE